MSKFGLTLRSTQKHVGENSKRKGICSVGEMLGLIK